MSASKATKTTKISSSTTSPLPSVNPTTTTKVSPKTAPKPATKTLFNYFTKLSKDKTENDLNESNRKRKLSTENNQQLPPVKILKSDEVLVVSDSSNLEITEPTVIIEEEKKPFYIKLMPISKNKKESKIKNSKRKSKDVKSEVLTSDGMDVDDDISLVVDKPSLEGNVNIEIEENKTSITDQNSGSDEKFESENGSQKVEPVLDELKDEKSEPAVETLNKENDEKPKLEVKTPRRKSTRIENSEEKILEENRNIAKEALLRKTESNQKKDADSKSESENAVTDDKSTDNNEIHDVSMENETKPSDISIISDDNSDDNLSGIITPAKLKNVLITNELGLAEKKLTPKQLKLKEKRRIAREEREKKLQEEREARQKEKEEQRKKEREEKEEQRRKEKAEKDEQRSKEREEKERKRLEEIQQKTEEKRKKDEEKRKKEDERKKKEAEKEEEKREKEQDRLKKEQDKLEEEQKKKREADKFKRFFRNSVDQTNTSATSTTTGQTSISSSQGNDSSNPATEASSNFMPFCIKGNMKLAPCTRKCLTDDQKSELENILDGKTLENQDSYLKQLKSQKYVVGKSEKTIPNSEDDNDVMVIDDELDTIGDEVVELKPKQQKYRAKFLLFNGNRRPPYYGTWRKKSTFVKPCKPFEMDTKYFNYEVDSDDEWEEDEPGESLKGSDDDYESNDDYEVDNEFFVPHGYLSDEENKAELDGEGADMEENDNHPDTQKAKLKILQQEFFAEHNKKTEKIKPKLIGCVWQNLNEDDDDDKYPAIIIKLLESHAMIMNEPIILKTLIPPAEENQIEPAASIEFTSEEVQDLIKLIHGNVHKRLFLVNEYIASRAEKLEAGKKEKLTKVKIKSKIREIAEWKRCVTDNTVMNNRYCWVVGANQLSEYNLTDLDVFNTWKYTLKPLRTIQSAATTKEDSNDGAVPIVNVTTTAAATTVVNSITKYTTSISKLSQNSDCSTTKKSPTQTKSSIAATSVTNPIQPTKKRVSLLMSVPRGQTFPQNKKNNLISEYLNNGKLNSNISNKNDDSAKKSLNPKATETNDETVKMDCDVIQLD